MTTSIVAVMVVIGLIVGLAFVVGMRVQRLVERVRRLEEAQRTRNPWPTNDALEDAMAVLNDAAWNAHQTLEYIDARTGQALEILKTARSNPYQYNGEQPNRKQAR